MGQVLVPAIVLVVLIPWPAVRMRGPKVGGRKDDVGKAHAKAYQGVHQMALRRQMPIPRIWDP